MASSSDQIDTVAGAESHPDTADQSTQPHETTSSQALPPPSTTPLTATTNAPTTDPTSANPEPTIEEKSSSPEPTLLSAPALNLTILLTTGARHAYRLDTKYLRSRNTLPTNSTGAIDPLELSGYQLKELIWTDWRTDDWEIRPANPSAVRLIVMGRMIEDKSSLHDYPFRTDEDATNVVHMTVRPADLMEDDEAVATSKDRMSIQ